MQLIRPPEVVFVLGRNTLNLHRNVVTRQVARKCGAFTWPQVNVPAD